MIRKLVFGLMLVALVMAGCTAPITQIPGATAQATVFLPVVEGSGKATAYPVAPEAPAAPTGYPGPEVAVPDNPSSPYPKPEGATAPFPEMPEGAALMFGRFGGIAGLNERWVVFEDGRVVDIAGTETKVDPAAIAMAIQLIRVAGFENFETMYGDNSGADKIVTQLAIQLDGKVKPVTVFDGATNIPQGWDAALAQIKALLGLQY